MSSIVVIDDNAAVCELVSEVLKLTGHTVTTFGSARAGLRAVDERAVDLVITDLVMPEQDGLETIARLRKSHPGIPIIAMSGDSPRHASVYLQASAKFGAARTLLKPFSVEQLVSAVDATLRVGGRDPRQ